MSESRFYSTVAFMSESAEWSTPEWLFKALDAEFGFTLDPCSTHLNAKCAKHYTEEENGLLRSWASEVVFMNPPYGKTIASWMAKAQASANEGATVVCLIPARTDTDWWHRFCMPNEIRFYRGRLAFGEGTNTAPFPSAVVVIRPREHALKELLVNSP